LWHLSLNTKSAELDGGRDGGYVWLACSCGAQIIEPVSEPPKAPAAT
jgi:hypothetical protein